MAEPNNAGTFLPGRKQDRAIAVEEAWHVLCSPDVPYGFLGTHGLREEGGFPYVVPMNFAADPTAGALYFHSTNEAASKRFRSIRENAQVSFTVVDPASSIIPDAEGRPCKFSMHYRSVMVFGRMTEVEPAHEKVRVLNFLMQQKAPGAGLDKVRPDDVEGVAIWKLEVEHVSGKMGG
jgi:nitroimidazol reductase NimA-like FMN-containing flavoprotein (pyridoxamine 5'-phosphate oxidase superfamily)